jgi:hypothetical protein
MFLVAIVFFATVFFCGANVFIYFDLPSLILVPIAPFLFMLLSYGWKGLAAAFRVPFLAASTKRELLASDSFFKSFSVAIWGFGLMGSTSGTIAILANLTDKTKVGPNAAVALITMLYAGIFNAALVLPFQAAARKRAMEMDS